MSEEGLLAKEDLTKLFPVFPSPFRVSPASPNNSHILKIFAIATRATRTTIKLYFILQHRRITEPVKSVANLIDSLHHEIPRETGMRIKNEGRESCFLAQLVFT